MMPPQIQENERRDVYTVRSYKGQQPDGKITARERYPLCNGWPESLVVLVHVELPLCILRGGTKVVRKMRGSPSDFGFIRRRGLV